MAKTNNTVVLLGGESEEREVSIQSGNNIAEALRSVGIEVDTFDWHPNRMQEFLSLGYKRVFIALHGGSGENGTLQAMLSLAGIPFTGVRMLPAAICMDKTIAKTLVSQTSVPVPGGCNLSVKAIRDIQKAGKTREKWQKIADSLGLPLVVKPARNGSSVGVTIVDTVDEMDDAVHAACLSDDEIVIFEQYIGGHELTVATLNGKALGVCQIIPKTRFYDYEAKYNRDDTVYLTPSSLGADFDAKLCSYAEIVVRALDCTSGVVRVDFLADRDLNAYFLEVNTVPGMTAHSLVPKIAAKAGYDFGTLCRMILDMAH
jgi:D-alanine-D-alanine ligase